MGATELVIIILESMVVGKPLSETVLTILCEIGVTGVCKVVAAVMGRLRQAQTDVNRAAKLPGQSTPHPAGAADAVTAARFWQ